MKQEEKASRELSPVMQAYERALSPEGKAERKAAVEHQKTLIERHKALLAQKLGAEHPLARGPRAMNDPERLGFTTIAEDEETGRYVIRYVVEIPGQQLAQLNDLGRKAFVERAAASFAEEFGVFWGVAAKHAAKHAANGTKGMKPPAKKKAKTRRAAR